MPTPHAQVENNCAQQQSVNLEEAPASVRSGQSLAQHPESPTSPFSSGSEELCLDSQSSVGDDEGTAETIRKKSWGIRIRRILHLRSSDPGFRDDIYPRQIIRSLNNHLVGYGKVAAFQDCDPSFLIFRKFGSLHNRALLYLQDELSELEDELRVTDEIEFADGDERRLRSRRRDFADGSDSIRKYLLPKIDEKLKEYDELLLRVQQIQALKRPTERAQRSLFNLIKGTNSLEPRETDWLRCGPDLAALTTGPEHGWFNNFVEDVLNNMSRRLTTAIFRSGEQRIQAGDEAIQLLSPNRIDILLRVLLTILAAILLLVPVFVLFELQPSHPSEVKTKSNYQILTVFLFTLLFSASCSIFTRARRQEVFAATAAYCGVLVVFLGNTSNVVVATNGLLNQNGA